MAGTDTAARTLRARYREVQGRIADAAAKANRQPEDILLVAVTKYAAQEDIRALIEMGHRDFGENKLQQLVQRAVMVQEAGARAAMLEHTRKQTGAQAATSDQVRWHMVGHVQRNKARKIAEYARLIHSVDSFRLADELQTVGHKRDRPVDVLLQVNMTGEDSKYGCVPSAVAALAEQMDTMVFVNLRGLMVMGPTKDDEHMSLTRSVFRRTRELFEELRDEGVVEPTFNILSMGMSGDFEIAIEEGANVVRVGSAIFGAAADDSGQ